MALRRALPLALAVAALAPAAAQALPADPLLEQQWALQRDVAADVPAAWRHSTGEGVVVAVVDSGIDLGHPQFAGRIVQGTDLVDGDGTPQDTNGHGTHVAGVIAAAADGDGTVGVAPGARIMPVRVLDGRMAGDSHTLAQGIAWAVDHGAEVINVSINGDGSDEVVDQAIAHAQAKGVTIVASAGNQGRNIDSAPSFPAGSPSPNVLSVGSVGPGGLLSFFSNFGRTAVDVAAPGEDILSTARGGGYEERTGTSSAAPLVTGAMALLRAARPGVPQDQLREALVATAHRSSGLLDRTADGAVDVGAAVARVLGLPEPAADVAPSTAKPKKKAKKAASCKVPKGLKGKKLRAAKKRAASCRKKAAAAKKAAARRRAAR